MEKNKNPRTFSQNRFWKKIKPPLGPQKYCQFSDLEGGFYFYLPGTPDRIWIANPVTFDPDRIWTANPVTFGPDRIWTANPVTFDPDRIWTALLTAS